MGRFGQRYAWGVSRDVFAQLHDSQKQHRPIEAFGLYWSIEELRADMPWTGEATFEVVVVRAVIEVNATIAPLTMPLPAPPLSRLVAPQKDD